ncbi:MAG: type II secretion system F family protein [archaeon]
MGRIEDLKKILEKKPAKKEEKEEIKSEEAVDYEVLSKIVERLKSKYVEEGITTEEYGRAAALKEVLEYGPRATKIVGPTVRELQVHENPTIRALGSFYLKFQNIFSYFSTFFERLFGKGLEDQLAAADMPYTIQQYIALLISGIFILELVALIFFILLLSVGAISLPILVLGLLILPFVGLAFGLVIPRSRASKIAADIEKHLPFALRHMSIEIRAGVGIHKTLTSVAHGGYGAFSEGLRWVLLNIEKGIPTEDALQAWANKTNSEALKRVVAHIVRALRTGGNLSEIMITIAEDVSFERKSKIADFAEKLNLLGLFLMMGAVVLPVMITILTTIGSAPAIKKYLAMFSVFSVDFLILLYFVICPALIFVFIYYIKVSDPGA